MSAMYITNPEAVASYTADFPSAVSKKGLCIGFNQDLESDITALNPKHVEINMVVSQLFAEDASGSYSYTYHGITYYFNKWLVDSYDHIVKNMTDQGRTVTAVLLNRYYAGSLYENLYNTQGSGWGIRCRSAWLREMARRIRRLPLLPCW